MNTDYAYVIGQSHQVCQDYARAGEGYALLSDGCSSSPDTDIGARLMVLAAEQSFKMSQEGSVNSWEPWICAAVQRARASADALGVGPTATDATLWMILSDDRSDEIQVVGWGDGAVAVGNADGSIKIETINYHDNAPFYPAYLLDEERLAAWRVSEPSVQQTRCESNGRNDAMDSTERRGNAEFSAWIFPRGTIRFVAVFSDGVGSFTERMESGETRAIPVGEIVRDLVDFKSFKGAFAQRRMNAFLKQCAVRGWKHHDDLSMAVIAHSQEDLRKSFRKS